MNAVEKFDPGCGFLSAEEIDDALNGQLSEARFAEFDVHVEDGCAECVTLAADLELFRAVATDEPLQIERREDDAHAAAFRERLRQEVRAVHGGAAPSVRAREASGWSFGWTWALGAAAMLLLAVGAFFTLRGPGGVPGTFAIPLPGGASYVAQVKQFDTAPVLRGEPDLQSLWREAETAYTGGDFAAAERTLAAIAERAPRSFDALTYRGVSLLALGRVGEAAEVLAAARAAALLEDASTTSIAWFQALAAFAGKDVSAGTSFLEEAAGGTGEYAGFARELLRSLE
jgi:hypothetical protein